MWRRQERFLYGGLITIGVEFIVFVAFLTWCIIDEIIPDKPNKSYAVNTEIEEKQTTLLHNEDNSYEYPENLVFYIPSSNPYSRIFNNLETSEDIEEINSLQTKQVINETAEYYNPTEEERKWMYKMVYAESGNQDSLGQIYVANVIINRAIKNDSNVIDVSLQEGQFSCIHNGEPSVNRDGKWVSVTEDMITDELKEAVDEAFKKDYTEHLLQKIAEDKKLDEDYYKGGALYFYNPGRVSQDATDSRSNIKVSFKHGSHIFYRLWNK